MPIEARDFGMYVGFLAVWGYLGLLGRGRAKGMPPAPILLTLVLFVGVMGFDGINAFAYDLKKNLPLIPSLYEPRLQLRLATGLLTGIAFAGILAPIVNYSLWRADDHRPIIANWKQLGGALVVALALYIVNEARLGILLYPVSIVIAASVPILVGLINMVFLLSLFRKEGLAVTLFDALNPFAAGVFLALIELGILSLMRYAVLGTTILP
ncbi:MAG: DUF2085 domain-containing protein [Anaerolineales bacterium]|nr:DUF2085 domain-containing protein [Anaerolineales bacterium]